MKHYWYGSVQNDHTVFLVNKLSTEENFMKEIIYDLDLGGWIEGPQSEEI